MTTDARASQEVVEPLVSGTPAARSSQEVVEPLVSGSPNARASQTEVEPLVSGSPNARASQTEVEALVAGVPNARASQTDVEVLLKNNPTAHVSQIVIEVLYINLGLLMLPVYPNLPGLAFDVHWIPTFFNMATQVTAAGAEIDLALADSPTHQFDLIYNFLRDSFQSGTQEFKTFMGFFLSMRGAFGRFLFKNPDDNSVVSQSVGTTDGLAFVFGPLSRTYGVGDNSGTEPVGYVDLTQPFNVYLDGVLQDHTTYEVLTVDPVSQQLKFFATPSAGKVITVDMSYFYYCKFVDSTLDFSKFMDRLWSLQKVSIKSCRAGT